MGETVLKGEAGHSVSIEDQVSGECKEDGAYCKNVCGTYVHGVFDREDVAEAVKGADVIDTDVWVSMGEPDEVWEEKNPGIKPL